jgi:hypothetical protein
MTNRTSSDETPPATFHDEGPTCWLMAGGLDAESELLLKCKDAAAGIRRGEYLLMRLSIVGQSNRNRWLIPKTCSTEGLPEVRIVDETVRIRENDERILMGMIARALDGTLMSHDEGNRAFNALRAIVVSENLMERCQEAEQRVLRAAMPTPWGPACAEDFYRGRTIAQKAPEDVCRTDLGSLPIGDAARDLPICTLVGFRNEPDHDNHIRLDTLNVLCTEQNAPDPMDVLRSLKDLADVPFA